jgi:phosphatidylglycerophosphate synthase
MCKKSMMILVNLLTTIRIVSVICLLPIYLRYDGVAAGLLSIFCYSTDLFDGIIARKCKVATFFGCMYDCVADKAFTIANLLVLVTITKYAIVLVLCECAIMMIQTIKYSNNINVQSSYAGKVKTWIIALTVIALYLATDIDKLVFLPETFINNIVMMDKHLLFGIIIVPVFVFELLTILSYLIVLKGCDIKQKVEAPNIKVYLKKPDCWQNRWNNICAVWFNYDFYMKYKDSAGLRDIFKQCRYKEKKAK